MTPEERRAYRREYYRRNRDKVRAYGKTEAAKAYRREYYQRNRDKLREQRREYYEQNKEIVKAQRATYYEQNRETVRQRQDVYREQRQDKIREQRREYYLRNRDELNARAREKYQRNRATENERSKLRSLKNRHGLYPEDRDVMWDAQDGRCYLCGGELERGRRSHVEHDHSCCGKDRSCPVCRRGLACWECNFVVGYARDDPARLRRIADALETAQRGVEKRKAASGEQLRLLDV